MIDERKVERVTIDSFPIGMFAIKLTTPDGDEITPIINRFWVLCLIDVATRTVLGYSVSLMKEYNANEVMQCIRNTVLPSQKKVLTINGLSYDFFGGFPAEVFPETEWCSINIGPTDLPSRKGIIKRFFKTLEEAGFHRLP